MLRTGSNERKAAEMTNQSLNLQAGYLWARLAALGFWTLLAAGVVVGVVWWLGRDRPEPAGASETGRRWWERFGAGSPSRTVLQVGFGALWILDGLLQAQAEMPREFVPMVLEPALTGQPAWVVHLGRVGINLWSLHTITTDAFSVFVQLAIGLGILFGGESVVGRLALAASIAWGLVVWTLGEGMANLFVQNATWLQGTPGAVLCYVVAATVLLLLPSWRWERLRAGFGRWTFRVGGAMLVALALIQAIPWEGFWQGQALSSVFASAAQNSQPDVLARPIVSVAHLAARDPAVVNGVVVGALAVVGIWLASGRARRGALWAAGAFLFASWWLGMDFGVLGGTGTDPNIAVPFALFLAAAAVALAEAEGRVPVRGVDGRLEDGFEPGTAPERTDAPIPVGPRAGALGGLGSLTLAMAGPGVGAVGPGTVRSGGGPGGPSRDRSPAQSLRAWVARYPLRSWLIAAMAAASAWTVVPVLGALPAASRVPEGVTLAYVQSGGLATVPGRPKAPDFTLVNQNGVRTSLSEFRGKVVVLSFLDPVCYSTCPVVAEELAQVANLLQARRSDVVFVVVNANPNFTSTATIRAFDAEHGVAHLADWEFLTGSRAQLQAVWNAYGAPSLTPTVGMVAHSLLVYLIGPGGRERALTQATGTPGVHIQEAYAELFADEASHLMPHA